MALRRMSKIKRLKEILSNIDQLCLERCVHIGAWYCNRTCNIPACRRITVLLLERMGVQAPPDTRISEIERQLRYGQDSCQN